MLLDSLYIYCRYTSGLKALLIQKQATYQHFKSEDRMFIRHIYYEVPPYQTYYQLAADTTHVSPIFAIKDKDNIWEQLGLPLSIPYNYQPPY